MSLDDLYIIKQDFQVIPVDELGEEVRKRFSYNEGDFAISNPFSRLSSKIIDNNAGILLNEFSTPKSLVEGIASFSVKKNLDAQSILQSSYSFLQQLKTAGILVPANSPGSNKIASQFTEGEEFRGYRITKLICIVEDTEIYKVSQNETDFALKISREPSNATLNHRFQNEINILSGITSDHVPKIIDKGYFNNSPYIIMEWVEGEHASIAAAKIRNNPLIDTNSELLRLCIKILKAYVDLHKQHIIHSDIHHKNVLAHNNNVKVIDFGLSHTEFSTEDVVSDRGGIGFYFEPEYAKAWLTKQKAPPTSIKSEQYSIAALLFFLFTGKHYINFSYENNASYKQIAYEEPISFSDAGVLGCDSIEKIFRKALSKDPADRYNNIEEFLNELSKVKITPATVYNITNTEGKLLNKVIGRLSFDGQIIENGLSTSPANSVNYGAAGIAYFLYRTSCLFGDARLLSASHVWAQHALKDTDNEKAFHNPAIEITRNTVEPAALYHSITGVHCVNALVSNAIGLTSAVNKSIDNFIESGSVKFNNLDLATGKTGLLVGCSLMLENFNNNQYIKKEKLISFGNEIMSGVWNELDLFAPVEEDKKIGYLGVAHGWAGILYATIMWCRVSGQQAPGNLEERINQLAACGVHNKNMVSWKRKMDEPVIWNGWCHGISGHIHLWTLAGNYFHEQKFKDLALLCGNFLLSTNDNTISSLCCGSAGQAYALLNLYRYSGEKRFLSSASRFYKQAIEKLPGSNLKNSLYKGDVGVALLEADLSNPGTASMPLFELHN